MAPFTEPETEAQASNLPGYRGSGSSSFYLISETTPSRKLSSPPSRQGSFWPLLSVPPHPGPHLMLPSVEAHSTLRGRTPKAGARAPQALSPPGPSLQLEPPRELEGRQEAREGGWTPIPGAKARPPALSVPPQPVCGWRVKKLTYLPSRNPLR